MDTTKRIIGIGGGIASGKTHAGKIAKQLGYHVIETSNLVKDRIIKKGGAKPTEEEYRLKEQSLVRTYDKGALGFLATKVIEQIDKKVFVICGLQNSEQIQSLKKYFQNALFVYIDADPSVRLQRAIEREKAKNKTGLSFDEEKVLYEKIRPEIEKEAIQTADFYVNLTATRNASDILIDNTNLSLDAYSELIKKHLLSFLPRL